MPWICSDEGVPLLTSTPGDLGGDHCGLLGVVHIAGDAPTAYSTFAVKFITT